MKSMPATLKTLTLGCKVNQYETELVREGLTRAGYRDAHEGEAADLCVVNTCTVTAEGDSKSRYAIRKLARENPDARIVVMGCYATRAPEELANRSRRYGTIASTASGRIGVVAAWSR
jgi:threonylcarbamoyladenosine tRNA methylthiotransferase MtaB